MPYTRRRRASSRRRTYKRRSYRRPMRSYKRRRTSYKSRRKVYRRTNRASRRMAKCVQTSLVPQNSFAPQTIAALTDNRPSVLSSIANNWIAFHMGNLMIKPIPYPQDMDEPDNNLRRRGSNRVMITSFKLDRMFRFAKQQNEFTDSTDPTQPFRIKVHWFLFQPKDYLSAEALGDVTQTTPTESIGLTNRFFRYNGDDTDTTRSFITTLDTGDEAKWDQRKDCLQINPDAMIRVISHKTFWLYPPPRYGSHTDTSSQKHIKKFFKLGKPAHWNDATAPLPKEPIFEGFWYQSAFPNQHPQTPIASGPWIQTVSCNKTYWADLD